MQHTKVATLVTISKVIQKHSKNWCYASQNTILNLLTLFHNVGIQRRMLNYHLADLRTSGMIRTYRRTHRREDGTLCLLSSATCLTMKGALFLYKLGSLWALRHFKALKKKYMPQPAPSPKNSGKTPGQPSKTPTKGINQNPFLDATCRSKMGLSPIPPKLKEIP
ncbi:hypothetical protein ES703_12508 [subsurface metagenome]